MAAMDRITYPLADSLALVVMGLLLGWLLGAVGRPAPRRKAPFPVLPMLAVAACLLAGRMIQYLIFDIYSSFAEKPVETVLWCLLTGIAISCVTAWLRPRISHGSRLKRAMVLGCLLFGMDLILFQLLYALGVCRQHSRSDPPYLHRYSGGDFGMPGVFRQDRCRRAIRSELDARRAKRWIWKMAP